MQVKRCVKLVQAGAMGLEDMSAAPNAQIPAHIAASDRQGHWLVLRVRIAARRSLRLNARQAPIAKLGRLRSWIADRDFTVRLPRSD